MMQICYRNDATGKLDVTSIDYTGPLARETMVLVNRLFLKKATTGYFYPLDPMDAYHDVWLDLERKASDLPPLTDDSPDNYLYGVAKLLILNWHTRHVAPVRNEYRKLNQLDLARLLNPSAFIRVSAPPPRPARDVKWKALLERLIALIDDPTIVAAFHAYVQANGNLYAVANILGMPKSTFYRRWPTYLATAREIALSHHLYKEIYERGSLRDTQISRKAMCLRRREYAATARSAFREVRSNLGTTGSADLT